MNRNFILLILAASFLMIDTEIKAQISLFKKERSSDKKIIQNEKDTYKYKYHFYSAIKERSTGNIDYAIDHFKKCIELNSIESLPYYELSRMYLHQDDFQSSLEYAKRAVELQNKNKWYLENYAHNLFKNTLFKESHKVFEELILIDEFNEDYYINLALSFLYSQNYSKAIETYNRLEKIKGINRFTSLEKYQIYLETQNYIKASEELERFLDEFPLEYDVYKMLSDLYVLSNNLEKSFQVLKSLSEIDTSMGAVDLILSDLYLQKNDTQLYYHHLSRGFKSRDLSSTIKIEKFIPILTTLDDNLYDLDVISQLAQSLVSTHPRESMTNYIYAEILNKSNILDSSIAYYKRSLELNQDNQQAWVSMMFLQLQLKEYNRLIIDSETALELYPTNPMIYYINALAFYNIKKYDNCIRSINSGLNFIVKNPSLKTEMYNLLGEIYNSIQDYEKSDSFYEKSLEVTPDNVYSLNNYAYYLSLRGEKLNKAKQMSYKTIEMFPKEPNYHDTYAWILFKLGELQEAKIHMEKAINLSETDNATFYDHMSEILLEIGDKERSIFYKDKSQEVKSKKNDIE